MFEFTVTGRLPGRGRTGRLTTPHGQITTPVFMPVGTAAAVKSLSPPDLETIGAQIILANNYHLFLRPGSRAIARLGGLHRFMNWSRPLLTDSGGFQIWSLGQDKAHFIQVNPQGFSFKSHLDGSSHFWTPQAAIRSQVLIGADIIMALDICTPDAASKTAARKALDITQDWLVKCRTQWQKSPPRSPQALFGIIQGGLHKDLRRSATQFVVDQDLPGLAIGGETIGYNMSGTEQVLEWISDLLPPDKPRYTMGVGLRPSDLVRAVTAGADMFDCVAPTRLARNGSLYVSPDIDPRERIDISNSRFRLDSTPIDPTCDCPTCHSFTRAYLHHLFKNRELLYYRLASLHNLRTLIRTIEKLSHSII